MLSLLYNMRHCHFPKNTTTGSLYVDIRLKSLEELQRCADLVCHMDMTHIQSSVQLISDSNAYCNDYMLLVICSSNRYFFWPSNIVVAIATIVVMIIFLIFLAQTKYFPHLKISTGWGSI